MKFEFNLLENSYDFIRTSLELFHVADEFGTHVEWKSDIQKKAKWKLAFIALVQACELLFKEVLFSDNPVLIYDNIDSANNDKTVTLMQGIKRIENMGLLTITEEEKLFLGNCIKTRNRFVHGEVSIQTEELKTKYCELFALYNQYHYSYIDKKVVDALEKAYRREIDNALHFAENLIIFRGQEMTRENKKEFEVEISDNRNHAYFLSASGEKVKRIPFGKENENFTERGKSEMVSTLYSVSYCDDCTAKQGEFHYELCDLEVCPICLGQVLTCDCALKVYKEPDEEKHASEDKCIPT